MATINVSVKYRPVRVGFLVRDGSIEDLVKAAGINTLLWGGIHNPIIPVAAGNSAFAKQLADLFSVDVLYGISNSTEIDKFINEHPFLHEPHHYGEEIFYDDWKSKKKILVYLDSINIVDYYWQKEIKNSPKEFKSNCALVRWDTDDPLSNLFSIQFGYFPKQYNLLNDFERVFVAGLKARESVIPKNGSIEAEIIENITPIGFTNLELRGYGGWYSDSGIFIGDEDNFSDLITFWNLRASGYNWEFLPKNHVQRFQSFIEKQFEKLDKRQPINSRLENWISLYYGRESEKEAQEIAKSFTTKQRKAFCGSDNVIWNGLNVRPATYYFGWETALGNIEESFGKPVVSLSLPQKKFLVDSSDIKDRNVDAQNLAITLDFYSDFNYRGHTLKPPFIRELNEFYGREIAIDPWVLRVEKEGIALIENTRENSVSLYPLSHQDIVNKIFDLAGIEAKVSQPGLLTTQIMESMKEFSPLDACRVFKVRGARKLLNELKINDLVTWKEGVKIIGQEVFDKFKKLYIEQREKPELDPRDVMNFLIKKRVLAPRLKLWNKIMRSKKEHRCNRCGLGSEILMSRFEGYWKCPYCENEQYLPEFIRPEFSDKTMWRFRKSGLFAKDNNQEGAIPVILSLLMFLRIFDLGKFIYSTSLNLHSDKSCEIDFCVLQYQRGDNIEIGIGECKSEKGYITAQDVENLKFVRDKLESRGLTCYLVFVKMADSFYDDEFKIFRKLVNEDIPFVLLTNRELEPYYPYWDKESDKLPVRHPFTFAELALNSRFVYLNN